MDKLPSGTVTFLFTDIEGSTKRWEEEPAAMSASLATHDALLGKIFTGHGGYVFKTIGDAFCVAFARATAAVAAAMEAQRALYKEEWPVSGGIRVRMAIHVGMTEERDGDYFGPAVNRVARLLSAGHGGQILMSLTTEELISGSLPAGARLEDMGEHSLKDLQRPEHIYQLYIDDLPANITALKTLNNRPHNLPLQNTTFIGREHDVKILREQLLRPDVRLLTLTGLGGTGKTRLSLRIGAELIEEFADGVFFVPLANEQEAGTVESVIAQTLGVTETHNSLLDSLKEALKPKQMLLILDNFEQVLGAAKLVSTLIASCPKIKLLVTSRAALRVYGEKEYAVPPLAVPNIRRKASIEELMANEAVQLFMTRAQAVKPDFELNEQNAATIAQICKKLDGLPLALELAAARIRLLTPQAMLTRLESRLKILTGGAKDLPARQQTLRGAIDWSYDLLNEVDRALFRRLSVFVGGSSLDAMESVCLLDGRLEIDVLNETESLVSKSLLKQETQDDGEPRFVMLETVREYALEKLAESGEAELVQALHLNFYLAFAESTESKLVGAQQAAWLNALEAEHDNLRVALAWALENNRIEEALRLAGALSRFWVLRSYFTEGRRRLAEALAVTEPQNSGGYELAMASVGHSEDDVRGYIEESLQAMNMVLSMADPRTLTEPALAARAKALNGAGNLSHRQGDYHEAQLLYLESLAIRQKMGDKQGIASSFNNLASVAYRQGDLRGARAMYNESLAIKRETGESRAIASTLNNLGILAQEMGEQAEARKLYNESLDIRRKISDRQGIAVSLEGLGVLAYEAKEHDKARLYLTECLQIRRDVRDKQGIAHVLHDLGNLFFAEEKYEQARRNWQNSLIIKQELNDKEGIAAALEAFARLEAMVGEPEGFEGALKLGAAADKLRAAIGAPRSANDERRFRASLEAARAGVSSKEADTIAELGGLISLEDAIAYALMDVDEGDSENERQ